MTLRDDLLDMKKEVNELREQSFAMELLHDQRKQNKRLFIIIIVILSMWFATIGYLVYVLNDIGTEEITTTETTTQEIEDVDTIEGNVINRGN